MTEVVLKFNLPHVEMTPTADGAEEFRAGWAAIFNDLIGFMQTAAIDAKYAYGAACSQKMLAEMLLDTWQEEIDRPMDRVIEDMRGHGLTWSQSLKREHATHV